VEVERVELVVSTVPPQVLSSAVVAGASVEEAEGIGDQVTDACTEAVRPAGR
jgi:hypothetical protein